MFEPGRPQEHVLECLRLEADCMQFAAETKSQTQASHFVRMSKVWAALANPQPSDSESQKSS
jgi:hypothetical protein